MSPEEREQMLALCQRIATENNRDVFLELVKRLNEMLNGKDMRGQHDRRRGSAEDEKIIK